MREHLEGCGLQMGLWHWYLLQNGVKVLSLEIQDTASGEVLAEQILKNPKLQF